MTEIVKTSPPLMVHGAGWLGGIGFTMSLFIAGLAFESAVLLTQVKLGILTASLFAGVVGWLLLWRVAPVVGRET
jgi:Na+:H+ antiporter, NhaA family